ncbi:hypothetical protein EPI10_005363 [Gossypium australe]|uniref:Uncharacterized protein n=1 Tax=Gossypium australe TaxID=47621 RepID=A0A5B6WN46_9ROSI|nr:hypothetical protein EPI10_005363 [Gossypium australe]
MDSSASKSKEGVGPVVSGPKFKKRAVSAVRDWPSSYGPASEQSSRKGCDNSRDSLVDEARNAKFGVTTFTVKSATYFQIIKV